MTHKNIRRVVSTVALASLAASMVACQVAPQFANGPALNPALNPSLVRSASVNQPRSEAEAKLADAVARGLDHVPGEYLVKLKPGASAQALTAQSGQFSAMSGMQTQPVGSTQSGIVLMKAGAGVMSAAAEGQTLQALRSNPAVLYAEPNHIVKLNDPQGATPPAPPTPPQSASAPNDPLYSQQWHHQNIQSEAGWAVTQGNKDFVLAIVDTGVDTEHPDLHDKLLPGYNTVDNTPAVHDGNGHGTHCAGIAAAITNNGVGVAGVAPDVKILPIQVLSAQGYGSYASVAAGIIKATDMGAKVISMSLGGPSSSQVITDAVEHALSNDVLLVAAMGNDAHCSDDNPCARKSYPAAVPGVMAIGATDSSDKIARFSQAGDWISVSAPGVNILSTFPTYSTQMPATNYGSISGTSMATPAVSGLAALVRSKFPELNAAQAKAQIEATADDEGPAGFDILYGHGRINVARALSTPPSAIR